MIRANILIRTILPMLVASVLPSLSCSAPPEYQKAVLQAQESVLRDDLSQMRKLLDQYAWDRGELPQSLEDLVQAGYMREIPQDPITGKKDWRVVRGEKQKGTGMLSGVIDIRSASPATSSEGKPYSEW